MSEQSLAEQLLAMEESTTSVLARVDGTTLYMSSPYKKSAVPALGKDGLGGKWKKETSEWAFPLHQLEQVRDTYRQHFGTAGMKTTSLISATIDMDQYMDAGYPFRTQDESMSRRGLYIMGDRPVAFYKTDQGASPEVRLIQGVKIVQGGFYLEGDDPKTMEILPYPATVLSISELDMRASVRVAAEMMNVHGTPKTKAIQLFGGDAGTIETQSSVADTKAAVQKAVDKVDDSLKDKAKEFETLLAAVARTLVDNSLPKSMLNKMLHENGLERV